MKQYNNLKMVLSLQMQMLENNENFISKAKEENKILKHNISNFKKHIQKLELKGVN